MSKKQIKRDIIMLMKKSLFCHRLVACALLAVLLFAAGGCGAKAPEGGVRIGSLKGPTSMGLLFLKEKTETAEKNLQGEYTFRMATQADELLPLMVKGELDIALVPANVAAILYQKTNGGVVAVDINTLGVLYLVTGDETVQTLQDLQGRKVYLTGKGTTPDYVLNYLLAENGLAEDCSLEYRSEASEVAALLADNPGSVGLLPQPFVTAACLQNPALRATVSLNDCWEALQGSEGSRMVTGVTVVRRAFLEEYEKTVQQFVEDHRESAEAINADPVQGALLAAAAGIVAREAIAEAAIPACNITCITGEEMKQALSGYLEVLYGQDSASVGGSLPGEDFYYIGVSAQED